MITTTAALVAALMLPSGETALTASAMPPDGTQILASATPAEREFLRCIRLRESGGDPRARNPRSSAAGLYQFLTATRQGNARWARWGNTYPARKYPKAHLAPRGVQHLVALHSIRRGGWTHWYYAGSRCNALGRRLP